MKKTDQKQKRALFVFIIILLLSMLDSRVSVSGGIITPPAASIQVVMDNNHPSYVFLDEQRIAQGVLVDRWALWEKHIGVKEVTGFADINNRWFGAWQGSRWLELPYLRAGILIALLIIFILIVFARALQKRVNQRTYELNQALLNLQKSEREYREIFNATTEAIFVHAEADGRLLHVNESMLQMYGYESEAEVLSTNISSLSINQPPYTQIDALEKINKALREGPQVFEWLAQKKNGEIFWTEVSLRSSPIGGENQVLAVVRDITARKQAGQALRESESLLRESQTIADMGRYELDFSSGLWKSSAILDKLFGIDDTCVRSIETWIALIHPEHRQQMSDYFTHEVMGRRADFDREYKIIRKNDQVTRWVHGLGALEVDAQNNLLKMRGVIQDITARKQVEDEMRQRVMELETLYESGLSINQLLRPDEIAQKVIELLEQNLGWNHTTVRLYHPQDESLELLAFNQPGLQSEAQKRKVEETFNLLITSASQGVSGWAVRHKQIVRSNSLTSDSRYVNTYPGLQSGLYVPMMLGDRVIGVISIESEQTNVFSAADERLVATLANQAASALENARLFEAERKQRLVSDALRDALSAGASMSVSLDFETILDRLLEALERVVCFEGACIMFVQSKKYTVNVARLRGYKKADPQSLEKISNFNFDIALVENLRWMFENKQPLVIPDVKQYPNWVQTQETKFIRSWAGAPIIVNDEVIAFFSLDSSNPNFFTSEDVELMRAFTGQASLALQNARLFEQVESRFKEFAVLYETSNILSGENDLNPMLQFIVDRARQLLGASSGGMYLYLSETRELELTVDATHSTPLGTRLQFNEGAAGLVAQTQMPLRIEDYSVWEGRSPIFNKSAIRAVIDVPMLYGGELIGVLTAEEIGDSERKFTESDERLLSLFASQAAGAIHSARLREQTMRRLSQLQALHLIDRAISSSFDLRPILNTVIAQTIAQLNVDAVDVLLYHPHLQMLDFVAGQGFRTRAIEQTHLRLVECFAGRAAFERRTVHIPNLTEFGINFTRSVILESEGFLEYYAVPLMAKGEVKGVLEVFHRKSLPQNPEWLDFLETLAGQAAITIDQTQLFDDLQRANLELITAYDATIEGWARAMDLRDKETESHTRRVTELTIALAKAMGIKDSEILHIRRGALLHDIGKMGVPDNILLKEGELTDKEWVLMRQHPQFAYEMLQPIKYLRQSLDIPYCHHEKWDGTGYPRGLKGEQIPLAARMFAVVDVWDAVTIDRPYRKGWSKKKALEHIKEQSGKQFDPKIVEIIFEND